MAVAVILDGKSQKLVSPATAATNQRLMSVESSESSSAPSEHLPFSQMGIEEVL